MSKITDFLASVKLTIVLLAVLAATSIIGTIIPQQESPQAYIQYYGQDTAALLQKLHLTNMYQASWFILLLALLAANLLVCSIKRFPATLRAYKATPRMKPGDFANMSIRAEKFYKQPPSGWEEKTEHFLSKHLGKPRVEKTDGATVYFAEKGRWSRFGVYVVHFSVLLIFAGAIIGALYGFKGMVNIAEGDSMDQIYLRGDFKPLKLGFSVRCDSFTVEFYPTGAPKEFRSDLTFTKDGKSVKPHPLRVNDPVTFDGITFYQSSYGQTLGGEITFEITDRKTGEKHVLTGSTDSDFKLPDGKSKFTIIDYRADLMRFGPAVKIRLLEGDGENKTFWVFEKQPPFVRRPQGPYEYQLLKTQQVYYTGLQANRDPGVWLVYTGFSVMVLGLLMSFFTSHRMLWVQLRNKENRWQVIMAGSTNKNRSGFERTFDSWRRRFLSARD